MGITASTDRDIESRNRIVSDFDTSFFVEAGAGSGKTTMLVRRMVGMVEHGMEIGSISAITFTKAAAGEFYDRFQRLLIERSNPDTVWVDSGSAGQLPEPTEETRERCARALQNIDLCFMGTIDAFCYQILSEHPSEAGIASDAVIADDEAVSRLYEDLYVRIKEGDCGKELADLAATFQTLHYDPKVVFLAGMRLWMENRNVDFHFERRTDLSIVDTQYADLRGELVRMADCLRSHTELQYTKNKPSVEAWTKIANAYQRLSGTWSASIPDVLYAISTLKKIRLLPEAMKKFPDELSPFFEFGGKKQGWLEFRVDSRLEDLQDNLKELQYQVSMTFLEQCVPVLESAMRARGMMSFFDCLYHLRNMLKEDAGKGGALIRSIAKRHRYFLIDEFQDTNPLQAEIFFYLAAERPVPGWTDCVPRPGSLFIVGDPKQSIYRFRSADVTSFLKVRRLFEDKGGAVLSLSRNFRSTRDLCEYFNRVFGREFAVETENQSRCEEIPLPQSTTDEFQGVYFYEALTGNNKETRANPEKTDPFRILQIIRTLVGNDRYLLRGPDDEEPRPIRYGDIMVITSRKKDLAPIMDRLEKEEIPIRVEGKVTFEKNRPLLALSTLYAAVADPDDRMALYAALRGEILALDELEILQYRRDGGVLSLTSTVELPESAKPAARKTEEVLKALKDLRWEALRFSPSALFTTLLDRFQLFDRVPAENLEVFCYALELMRAAESDGTIVDLRDGARFLAALVHGESGEERCLKLEDNSNCVHLANLHKVKGLEAPIVILAAADSKSPNPTVRVVHGKDASDGWVFALQSDWGSHFATDAFGDEEAAEADALVAENARLVYVAATRARNALIICRHKDTGKWSPLMNPAPRPFPFAEESVGSDRKTAVTTSAAELYEKAKREDALQNQSAQDPTFQVENPSRLKLVSRARALPEGSQVIPAQPVPEDTDGGADDEEATRASYGKQIPALLGTMVHKLMEMLVSSRNRLDPTAATDEILREFLPPEYEPWREELRKDLLSVANRMRNGGYPQTNGLPADMLNFLLTADEVCCEVPFSYREETDHGPALWNGVMDVVCRAQGQWHIIDYKTNADGEHLDVKYQGQLEAYKRALKAIMGLEADAFTYHIAI